MNAPAPAVPVDATDATVPAATETVPAVPDTTETEVPDMGVEPGASAPAVPDPAPVETPVEVEAPVVPAPAVQKPKAPANKATWTQVRTVERRPVVRRSEVQRVVISPSRPVIQPRAPVTRRNVHKPARHASRPSKSRWYQVPAAQYQRTPEATLSKASKSAPTRTQKSSASSRPAAPRTAIHIRGKPSSGTWICAQKAARCLDSCAHNLGWKVAENGRWISGCKSPNAAEDMLHEDPNSDADRAGSGSDGKPGRQYQCPGAQYHDYWCDDSLGESPVDTYVGMMRYNVERIVQALS